VKVLENENLKRIFELEKLRAENAAMRAALGCPSAPVLRVLGLVGDWQRAGRWPVR